MRTGGEAVRHRFRKARVRPRRVVLLCDVSGSMAPYSRALLRFLHASVVSGASVGGVRPWEPGSPGSPASSPTRDPDRALRQASGAYEDIVGRDPARRRHQGVRGPLGTARHGARSRRGHPLRRLGPRRRGGARRADAAPPRLAHRVIWVNPLKAPQATNRSPAAWPPRSRTSTCSSRATTSSPWKSSPAPSPAQQKER